jgi:hypothetical protein
MLDLLGKLVPGHPMACHLADASLWATLESDECYMMTKHTKVLILNVVALRVTGWRPSPLIMRR